jgi:hypothetical protein
LYGGFVRLEFVDAAALKMPQFVGIDVLGSVTLGAVTEGSSVEPCFAEANIGNGSARVYDDPICEREMVQDDLPRSAVTNHVNAMTSYECEFTDEPLQFLDTFMTIIVIPADGGDPGK